VSSPEYHLALSVSHNSSAALIEDGKIIVAVCEERSRRKKNYIGYPKNAVDYCLKKSGIKPEQLSRVAYTTRDNPGLLVKAKTNTEFSLSDYRDYYGERFYKRRLRGEDCTDYLKWLRDDPRFNKDQEHFDFSYLTDEVLADGRLEIEMFRAESARLLASELGIARERIEFLDHHTCHAYYSYFGSPFRGEDCIVLTLDGWGDGRNQTVWRVSDERFTLLAESSQNDLGRIYKMATLILGMRPDEHEFKVMGLAPYAKASYAERAMAVLENLCDVDGMRIVSKNRPKDLFSYLAEMWKVHRFDNIAAAVQLYTERIACKLVSNIVKETGIRRLVIGGGIAMNIKMNKAIAELEEVDAMFVCGSSGDESLSIGGCYYLNGDPQKNIPLTGLYLGYDIADEIVDFDPRFYADRYVVNEQATPNDVAQLLAKGEIVAVVRGRAEFGARALGNRSILANPSHRSTVQQINEAIKNRDFWMPFALSILEEHADEYLINPKSLSSPFMAISLDVQPGLHFCIEAGTHPYDKTVRPQFVSRKVAPQYHRLISIFFELTGIPALLNTSFNLHGEPIVDTVADAVRTFELSGLDHLLIDDCVLLSKRRVAPVSVL
jgi:carbamoyltransferase